MPKGKGYPMAKPGKKMPSKPMMPMKKKGGK